MMMGFSSAIGRGKNLHPFLRAALLFFVVVVVALLERFLAVLLERLSVLLELFEYFLGERRRILADPAGFNVIVPEKLAVGAFFRPDRIVVAVFSFFFFFASFFDRRDEFAPGAVVVQARQAVGLLALGVVVELGAGRQRRDENAQQGDEPERVLVRLAVVEADLRYRASAHETAENDDGEIDAAVAPVAEVESVPVRVLLDDQGLHLVEVVAPLTGRPVARSVFVAHAISS
jgi:hypothetical protein